MVICQLYSDIHLEFYNANPGKSRDSLITKILCQSSNLGAKYLFLAGDIGNSKKSFKNFFNTSSY